jgi:hypothetical protein
VALGGKGLSKTGKTKTLLLARSGQRLSMRTLRPLMSSFFWSAPTSSIRITLTTRRCKEP